MNDKARDEYLKTRDQVEARIQQLTEVFHEHGLGEKINYDHVGSMAHVREELDNLLRFLGAKPRDDVLIDRGDGRRVKITVPK